MAGTKESLRSSGLLEMAAKFPNFLKVDECTGSGTSFNIKLVTRYLHWINYFSFRFFFVWWWVFI